MPVLRTLLRLLASTRRLHRVDAVRLLCAGKVLSAAWEPLVIAMLFVISGKETLLSVTPFATPHAPRTCSNHPVLWIVDCRSG